MAYNTIDPDHYRKGRKYEPIDVIEDWELNYRLGNALKYISRNKRKPNEDPVEGLRKAIWYIQREIDSYSEATNHYQVTYQDILEDYAACAAENTFIREGLDDNPWDDFRLKT